MNPMPLVRVCLIVVGIVVLVAALVVGGCLYLQAHP